MANYEAMSAAEMITKTRAAFATGRTKSLEWRLKQLQGIAKMTRDHHNDLIKAAEGDMRKPHFETVLGEISFVRSEVSHAINNLKQWMKPILPGKSMAQIFDAPQIRKEPYGVVLIIGAWNYPFQLVILPLIGAIAAGNCAILKPSEIAPNMAKFFTDVLPQYVDKECIQVYNGGVQETTELLQEKFDYIFYTGSSQVGKIIMKAASEHLTPVTLELGGKSPVYVNKKSDIALVAKRITWGKFFNLGQTCIAPDYILCDKSIAADFITELKNAIVKHYGENPETSADLARIISDRHFQRLKSVLDECNDEDIVFGGTTNEADRYISPTLIKDDVKMKGAVMQQEIFGPLLGFIQVENEDEAIQLINSREKPLAMYLFSKDPKVIDKILNSTSCGGVTVNDTMMHNVSTNMPFGGVGNSGTGRYHGKYTFDTFSHEKPIMYRKQNMEAVIAGRYPPYTESNLKQMVADRRKNIFFMFRAMKLLLFMS